MFRNLNWKLPISYRQEEIKNALSCDWQIYVACANCGWEMRWEATYGVPDETSLTTPCKKCDHSGLYISRHLMKIECICQECSHYFEKYNISNLNELACPNCTSRYLDLVGLLILPPFPEVFGEWFSDKVQNWGESAKDDINFILDSIQFLNLLPDRELQILPPLKLCERLRVFSKYPSDNDLGLIWNVEGTLLSEYFKLTEEISAGIECIEAYQESINLTEEPIQQALVIHNLAMVCYSLLVRRSQDDLTEYGAPLNLKEMGLKNAFEALKIFETGPGSNKPYSAAQVARIHFIIGDLYKIGEATDEDLRLSIVHLDKALEGKVLSEREISAIAESKSLAISLMTNPPDELKAQVEPGYKEFSTRDEKDRAFSEKWRTLQNLSVHYWEQGRYKEALMSIEEAAALAMYEMGNALDISTVELRSRQFVDVFKILFRNYVQFGRGLEALISLEQFRALVLELQISSTNPELNENENSKKIPSSLIQFLATGKAGHTSIKKIFLPKKQFTEKLALLEKEFRNESVAFISLSTFGKITSAVLMISNKSRGKIKTYQWKTEENEYDVLTKNLPYLTETSIFQEKRINNLQQISSFFLLPDIFEKLKKERIRKLGLSIQSIFVPFPYEALKLSKNGLQLVDEFDLFYYPSLEILRKLSSFKVKSEQRRLLIIPYLGNDLKYSKIELDKLKRIAPNQITIFSSDTYNKKDLLIKMREDFDFIHFICHGTFDSLNPILSALVFDPNKGDAGNLYAEEISKLKFRNTPVISLSACSSALTSLDKFETYSGLTGSFLQAGARGIVGARWEIPDELGSEFMLYFYNLIFLKGCSAVEGVHKTQLYLKNEKRDKNWASFSYLGAP